MLIGDFYNTLGLPYMWQTEEEQLSDKRKAVFLTLIFLFIATNLIVSILLTIKTNPGNIPEDSEWDMPSEED